MNKKIAFDNRLCYERDVLRQQGIHQKKLQTILPTCQSPSKVYLDSNAPSKQQHLIANRKRLQVEKERQTEIYTQNQRLASKMEHILNRQENVVLAAGTPSSPLHHTPPVISPRGSTPHPVESAGKRGVTSPTKPLSSKPIHSPAYVHMPGLRLDATQTPMVDCYLSPEFAMGRGNACKKDTLVNRGVQRQKQQQVEDENRRLKARLKTQKPHYNTKKWDADWQHTAHKFQHLHQNGTVGYLLPRTAATASSGSHAATSGLGETTPPTPARSSRSPLVGGRRIKATNGLPSIQPKPSEGGTRTKSQGRGGRLQRQLDAMKTTAPSSTSSRPTSTEAVIMSDEEEEEEEEGEEEEYEEPQIVECEPFVLLEATTRKGVEISVEELQIEMRDPATGVVQPGDRGLRVRGRWNQTIEGNCLMAMDTLEKVAQEIDDLEMMIKLETISCLPGEGNFPRLSCLLTEDELQRLLLKLVQVLSIQIFEDTQELVISSRLSARSPSPSTVTRDHLFHEDQARPCTKPVARPRTCPCTLPSETLPPNSPSCGFEYPEEQTAAAPMDVSEQETQQYHRVLCKQLASILNGRAPGRRQAGLRLSCNSSYRLVRYLFNAERSAFEVKSLQCGGVSTSTEIQTQTQFTNIPIDGAQVTAMLELIQSSGQVPWQFIHKWLNENTTTAL